MKWSARQSSVVFAAAMLLPFAAAPESQDRTQAHSRAVATARVDFKIVIPKVLSLEVLAGIGPGITGQTVAIGSNGRTVALAATLNGAAVPRNDLILRAAAGRNIAQETACAIGARNPASTAIGRADARMICTVSTP